MRLYVEVARRGFRRYATYRAATVAGLMTNTVFGLLRGYVLIAVLRARGDINGYDLTDSLTYVWLTQGLIMVTYVWGWTDVADRVRTGAVATDLSRPFDFQVWWLAQDLGRAGYHTLTRGIPPFLIGALLFDLRLPEHPATFAVFGVSVLFAVLVSFAWRFLVNLGAFWIHDIGGLWVVYSIAVNFLSGFMVPVTFFPPVMRAVARALPFQAMIQTPIDVFLEKPAGLGGTLSTLGVQLAWALALLVAGRLVLSSATRRLVVQGG